MWWREMARPLAADLWRRRGLGKECRGLPSTAIPGPDRYRSYTSRFWLIYRGGQRAGLYAAGCPGWGRSRKQANFYRGEHGDPRRKTGSGATRARAMTAGLCGCGVMNFEPAADHGQTRAKAPRAKRHSFYHVNSGKPRFLAEPDLGHFLPSRCGRSQLVITPWRSVVLRVLRGKNLLACRRSNAPVPAGVPPRPVSRPENV